MRILSLILADFDAGSLVVWSIIRLDSGGSSDAIRMPVDSASPHTLRVAPVSASWLICDQVPDEARGVGAKRQSQADFPARRTAPRRCAAGRTYRFLHP
jgi:hypothetical protein